ncbi:polysaccharide biosynthesis protein [Photobacterium sp. WH77]|uniref:PssD/Cps14F family polysaccharide biosynthesis glycosyltransferase n=1 Tax=unclassified Photobacterium TaxID=2628852 RepID=UPI001EDA0B31|nr:MULTISPECIES: PssD/Cps14F family polysaccharide biosynthesis glycosyltransferase [unclassified Photobacterium]MCG2835706.1 polysaccharide biosynthesis protein [Photobacterium sp. WH77]MCG2843319.1 polysaccharide biosynthesis protein [Photobacterium sp. WH80]
MKPVVLFTYGEGGHQAQANRLAKLLKIELEDFDFISLSDSKVQAEWSVKHYIANELRGKHQRIGLFKFQSFINILSSIKKVKKENRLKVIISTGPGISVLSALYLKLFGVKVIHIETWSRFTSKSLTGRVMYYLANEFLVQNKSLLKVYPKAKYSGRL